MTETALRTYRCPWCARETDASARNCPSCGAPVDVRQAVTHSGWIKMPPIRDMVRIQLGQSVCQFEGKYVPVADFNLAANEGIYFGHHLMLWKDDAVRISAMAKGMFKRLFAGLPIVMTQATGPGRIAFSKDKPGEMIAIPLAPGQSMDVREHAFMIATQAVAYEGVSTNIWFRSRKGNETETHYPIGQIIDRFTASDRPGLLIVHGAGNVFVRDLNEGQSIFIKPTSLLYKSPTARMNLHIETPRGSEFYLGGSIRHMWLNIQGPGRVAVESNYPPMESSMPSVTGYDSLATTHWW